MRLANSDCWVCERLQSERRHYDIGGGIGQVRFQNVSLPVFNAMRDLSV